MADANQQAQELADLMSRVNREMELYGRMHQSTADEVQDAAMKSKYGITNFTKGTATAADALTSVAKAGVEGAKAMYEGKKGAAAFNSSIDELSNAAKLAGAALTLLIPGGPLIKGLIAGLTAVTAATAEYIKAANVMADKIYDGYSKLAKAGGAASDGMTGVYQGAKKLGLSMNELDSYVGLIADNAGDLTLFAGSVADGRKKFEDMGAAMEPYRKGLIAAGYTQQEINDASMQYLRLQSRIGQSQNLTTKQLAEGANAYLKEQDALTKLTGMSRKEQEQALEAARSQQRFRAKLEEMRNSGDAQQIKAADDMEVTYKMLYKRSKEAAAGYGDLATGMMGTDAAMKLYQSTQGEALNILDKQKAGQLDSIKAFEQTGKAVDRVTKEMNYLYQMGVGEDTMLKINEGAELGIAANKDLSKEYEKIREDQKKQGMEGGKAADGITDQYAENIKKQQELNKKMEDAVFVGIDKALSVTEKLGNVTNFLADQFTTLSKALNKVLGFFGLGAKEPAKEQPKTAQETKAAAATGKERDVAKPLKERVDLLAQQLEVEEKALKDAKRAGKYGEELKPLEEKIAKNKEEYAKASQSLLDQEKKIADAAREERKVRQQQRLDQGELARLETMNVSEVERLAKLNEERANLAAKGVSTAKVEQKITDTKASIETRSGQISTLKGKLAPVAGGGAAPAAGGGAAPGGKQELPSGVAPSTAGGGRGTARPPVIGTEGGSSGEESKPNVDKLLTFTERSGSKSAFEGLDQTFKDAVIRAAEEYNSVTGKTIQINSAKRDPADQERLYAETVKLGTPGKGPTGMAVAKPGRSLHERGHAVDIQQFKDPAAVAAFNKQGLSQKVAGDPVHFQAKEGAVLSGPDSGYQPSITMHGTEAIIPLKDGAVPVSLSGSPSFKLDTASLFNGAAGPTFTEDNLQKLPQISTPSFASVSAKDMSFGIEEMQSELLTSIMDAQSASTEKITPELPEGLSAPASIRDLVAILQENSNRTGEMVELISELLRAQKDQNSISGRLLQVATN